MRGFNTLSGIRGFGPHQAVRVHHAQRKDGFQYPVGHSGVRTTFGIWDNDTTPSFNTLSGIRGFGQIGNKGDSDGDVCFNTLSGIRGFGHHHRESWDAESGKFQYPVGHSGVRTVTLPQIGRLAKWIVSIPCRAFGGSDLLFLSLLLAACVGDWFQYPVGHSGVRTSHHCGCRNGPLRFNTLSGIRGFGPRSSG